MLRASISIHTHSNVESILLALGGFSRFQVWASFAILSPEVPAAMIAMIPVFVGANRSSGTMLNSSESSQEEGFFQQESVVHEWGLYDDYAWVTDSFTSVFMAGMMCGAIISSQLSDIFGRKKVHFVLIAMMSVFGIGSAFAPSPVLYALTRFFAGLGVGGFYCIYSIYLIEFLTPSWRVICGSISFWFLGEMILALLAYFVKSWRLLSLYTALPSLLGLLTYPFLPETPRWLLCQERKAEATQVFQEIAKWNKKPAPTNEAIEAVQSSILAERKAEDIEKSATVLTLWSQKDLRIRLAIFILLFFSVAFTYYGISFNVKNLSGDPYLNMLVMGAIDGFAFPSGSVFSHALGRRRVTALFLSFAAVTLVVLMGLETFFNLSEFWVTTLSFVVRLGIAGAWGVVVCFCQETFPTVVRSTALGICCLVGNTGGVLAPQISFVGVKFGAAIPHLVFTIMIVASSIVAWILPEMKGKPLQNF